MKKLLSKTDKIILLWTSIQRATLVLGGIGAIAEGRPIISGILLAVSGVAGEIQAAILKKTNP